MKMTIPLGVDLDANQVNSIVAYDQILSFVATAFAKDLNLLEVMLRRLHQDEKMEDHEREFIRAAITFVVASKEKS